MKVALITGTRPQIIKSVPLIRLLMKHDVFDFDFIHTGQHYDDDMFKDFIEEFELPYPYVLCDYTFARAMDALLELWKSDKPDVVIVPGDTDSALVASLVAVNLDIPVIHIEAGVREYDMTMREERNRRMIDHISSILFIPTEIGMFNLQSEGILGEMVLVGDTNYDLFLSGEYEDKDARDYGVLTIHRAANVDNAEVLTGILRQIEKSEVFFIFPVHPRTRKMLTDEHLSISNIMYAEPLGHDAMMSLVLDAKIVVTDSGGLQKEAFFANTPCVTMRDVTAWPETVIYGGNKLVGTDKIEEGIRMQYGIKLKNPKAYGDGSASRLIVEYMEAFI
jgi:UDP-N-acetylglucosamine 2-epimerase